MYVRGYDNRDGGQLGGFNPLKAIGRALGGVGRAIVGSVPLVGGAVASVLDTAAHQPADATPATQATQQAVALQAGAQTGATVNAANVPVGATTQAQPGMLPATTPPQAPAGQDPLTTALLMSLISKQTPMPSAGQPAPNINLTTPGYSGPSFMPSSAPSATPPWLLPVALGGAALMAIMAMQSKKA